MGLDRNEPLVRRSAIVARLSVLVAGDSIVAQFPIGNCPLVPEHGEVLPPKDGKSRYYCPHQEHDGRPKSHRLGEKAHSRAYFTKEEVQSGVLVES